MLNATTTAGAQLRNLAIIVICIALLAGINVVFNDYIVRVISTIFIFMILAVSYNLINGVTGQLSLEPNGFVAVGAYLYHTLQQQMRSRDDVELIVKADQLRHLIAGLPSAAAVREEAHALKDTLYGHHDFMLRVNAADGKPLLQTSVTSRPLPQVASVPAGRVKSMRKSALAKAARTSLSMATPLWWPKKALASWPRLGLPGTSRAALSWQSGLWWMASMSMRPMRPLAPATATRKGVVIVVRRKSERENERTEQGQTPNYVPAVGSCAHHRPQPWQRH